MTLRAFLSPVVQTRVFQTCFASLPFLILGQLGLTLLLLLLLTFMAYHDSHSTFYVFFLIIIICTLSY